MLTRSKRKRMEIEMELGFKENIQLLPKEVIINLLMFLI